MRSVLAASLALFLTSPRVADACSLAGNGQHQLDQAHSNDNVAPGATTASDLEVRRTEDEGDDFGCTRVAGCGSRGTIWFTPGATDNATPADRMGYQLRVVRGELPRGLRIDDPAITADGGQVFLYFDYDAPSFDFDLEIRAVDLNGNLGAPTVLNIAQRVDDDDGGGCASSSGQPATWGFAIAALVLVTRRRHRR